MDDRQTADLQSMLETARLDRSAFSVGTHDDDDQAAYWKRQSHEARLNALEFLRQAMWSYDRATSRLQRVLEIVRVPRR